MAIDRGKLNELLEAEAPTESDVAKRKLEESKRTSVGPLEWDGPDVVAWYKMPPEARAAAGAAALFARWQLDTKLVRYDERRRIAFAILPDPHVEGAPPKVAARVVPRTVEESLAPVRAAFGAVAVDLQRFIKRRS